MRARTRRVMRWLSVAVVVGLLVLGANVLFTKRVDPTTVPQSTWHSMATTSESGVFDPLPKEHRVVIEPLAESPWRVLASYLPPPIGRSGKGEVQGEYDAKTGDIRIEGKLVRLEASLPFPWARGMLVRALRHEYGHAFASDYLKSKDCKYGGEAFMGFAESGEKIEPKAYPKDMRPVAEEFAHVGAEVYGDPYFTQSFDEYLAESYQRFVSGKSVPPKTAAFLKSECER